MSSTPRRLTAVLSSIAMASAVVVSGSVAAAAESSVTWTEGTSGLGVTTITRTVSDTNPKVGDTITVTTDFARTTGGRNIHNLKDVHPTCLTYVDGSATVNGEAITSGLTVQNPDPDYPEIGFAKATGNWWVGILDENSKSFSFDYLVGSDCTPGAEYTTELHYDGTQGIGGGTAASGTSGDRGPSITIKKVDTDDTDDTATGSLGGIFGSLGSGSLGSFDS